MLLDKEGRLSGSISKPLCAWLVLDSFATVNHEPSFPACKVSEVGTVLASLMVCEFDCPAAVSESPARRVSHDLAYAAQTPCDTLCVGSEQEVSYRAPSDLPAPHSSRQTAPV